MPVIESSPLLTDDEVAKRLCVSVQTLSNWRCTGRNDLPFIRVGRCVRYSAEAVEKWLRDRTEGGEQQDV
jgi:excisionase family DNA binding protein